MWDLLNRWEFCVRVALERIAATNGGSLQIIGQINEIHFRKNEIHQTIITQLMIT